MSMIKFSPTALNLGSYFVLLVNFLGHPVYHANGTILPRDLWLANSHLRLQVSGDLESRPAKSKQSAHMEPEHASREKNTKIPLNLTSEGLRYPQEMRVQHETCSTICETPVQAIFDQKNLSGLAGGVKEGHNMA